MGKVAGGKLVLDQQIGGAVIRHAQQRLGQHHEGEPLLGGERIFVQEVLDTADPAGAGADRLDIALGAGVDPRLGGRRPRRLAQQPGRERRIGGRVGRKEGRKLAGAHGVCPVVSKMIGTPNR